MSMSVRARIERIEASVRLSIDGNWAGLARERAWLKLVEALEPIVEPIIGLRGDTDPVQYWVAMPEDLKAVVREIIRERVRRTIPSG